MCMGGVTGVRVRGATTTDVGGGAEVEIERRGGGHKEEAETRDFPG